MELDIRLGEGRKVEARWGQFTVRTDQGLDSGGEATAPEPFDCSANERGPFSSSRRRISSRSSSRNGPSVEARPNSFSGAQRTITRFPDSKETGHFAIGERIARTADGEGDRISGAELPLPPP